MQERAQTSRKTVSDHNKSMKICPPVKSELAHDFPMPSTWYNQNCVPISLDRRVSASFDRLLLLSVADASSRYFLACSSPALPNPTSRRHHIQLRGSNRVNPPILPLSFHYVAPHRIGPCAYVRPTNQNPACRTLLASRRERVTTRRLRRREASRTSWPRFVAYNRCVCWV